MHSHLDDIPFIKLSYDEIAESAFIKGAEWADSHPNSQWIDINNIQNMNKIWHDKGKPNFGTLVVIINSERKITFFGYYSFRNIELGEEWAYMIDMVNNTI